jgi:hypothetical protein
MQNAHEFLNCSKTSNKFGVCGELLEATPSTPRVPVYSLIQSGFALVEKFERL